MPACAARGNGLTAAGQKSGKQNRTPRRGLKRPPGRSAFVRVAPLRSWQSEKFPQLLQGGFFVFTAYFYGHSLAAFGRQSHHVQDAFASALRVPHRMTTEQGVSASRFAITPAARCAGPSGRSGYMQNSPMQTAPFQPRRTARSPSKRLDYSSTIQ